MMNWNDLNAEGQHLRRGGGNPNVADRCRGIRPRHLEQIGEETGNCKCPKQNATQPQNDGNTEQRIHCVQQSVTVNVRSVVEAVVDLQHWSDKQNQQHENNPEFEETAHRSSRLVSTSNRINANSRPRSVSKAEAPRLPGEDLYSWTDAPPEH